MKAMGENHYLLVVGPADPDRPGCLEAVTGTTSYSYDEAANAADAIAMAERRRPSLIVLNLHGSERSGLDVCRELVAAESTRDIPILAIAGAPLEQQFMISLSVMPCDSNALDREIHRLVSRVH
jgi:CheY-like chemotaxis protein